MYVSKINYDQYFLLTMHSCTVDQDIQKSMYFADIPGSETRVATLSGNPEACARAHKMVMDIVAEVKSTPNVVQYMHEKMQEIL